MGTVPYKLLLSVYWTKYIFEGIWWVFTETFHGAMVYQTILIWKQYIGSHLL